MPSLSGGGAEKVMLCLLQNMARCQFDLSLAVLDKSGSYLNDLPGDIPVYDLHCQRVRYALPRIVRLIREVQPEVVLSTLGHLNIALLMLRGFLPKGTKLLVREANTVSYMLQDWQFSRFWVFLYKYFYPGADMIISQSSYMRQDLIENIGVPTQRIMTIYNPVDIGRISSMAQAENPYPAGGHPNIVWVGRLTANKGPHQIIKAMPELLHKHPRAHLWLIGEGQLRQELSHLGRILNIQEHIHFAGFQANPYTWMHHADLMVLSSVYEGLPNVLLEAIACQCPVISLLHPGGTQEIIALTGQHERFVSALSWDDWWFDRPPANTLNKLEAHFGLHKIIQEYSNLLQHLE